MDGFVIGTTPTGNLVWIWNYEVGNIHFGINNTNRMVINSAAKKDPREFNGSSDLRTCQ